MGIINQLDSVIYNRISAGEVVERPFSVVKETVENAIDAGAARISVDITDGGRSFICVTDNGIGLAREDLRVAFLPHATSKIKSVEDLDNIATLGFRGEALASIASVAVVEMSSKQSDAECGNYIKIEGGKIVEEKPVNMADGTIIKVSDLFYNTPARAKFLKKSKSEEHDISKLMIDIILANPNVAISYTADGKSIYNSTGRGLEDAVYSVYSKDITNNLLPVKYSDDGYRIGGYISMPKFTKPTRAYQTTVINGRIVNNATVSTAVTQAYGDTLMRRNFPVFIIDIVMPFDALDVNVTPNKTDVRFVDTHAVFSKVYRAVKETLDKERKVFSLDSYLHDGDSVNTGAVNNHQQNISETVYNYNREILSPAENENIALTDTGNLFDNKSVKPRKYTDFFGDSVSDLFKAEINDKDIAAKSNDDIELSATSVNDNAISDKGLNDSIIKNIDNEIRNLSADSIKTKLYINDSSIADAFDGGDNGSLLYQMQMDNAAAGKKIEIIGQLFKSYLLVGDGEYIYIIDQHAAHERMIYDKLVKEIDNNYIASQMLMVPQIVELNPADWEFVSGIIDELQAIGLEIEEFGTTSFKITAVPSVFGGFNFNNYIDEILKSKRSLQQIKIKNIMRDKLAVTACKAAVKAGEVLSVLEIESLIAMMQDGLPLQCPHGRPAIIRIERKDIDKIFKRIL